MSKFCVTQLPIFNWCYLFHGTIELKVHRKILLLNEHGINNTMWVQKRETAEAEWLRFLLYWLELLCNLSLNSHLWSHRKFLMTYSNLSLRCTHKSENVATILCELTLSHIPYYFRWITCIMANVVDFRWEYDQTDMLQLIIWYLMGLRMLYEFPVAAITN